MWVIVGESIGYIKIVTSTDGIIWTPNDNYNSKGRCREVYWNGSFWLGAGYTADPTTSWAVANILMSTNGYRWTESFKHTKQNTSFNTIVYNRSINMWVAAGDKLIVYSKDGIDWKIVDTTLGILKLTVINSQFIGTVTSSMPYLISSSDGITWNLYNNNSYIPNGIMGNPEKVMLFKNNFIIGGFGAYQLAYSNNGNYWSGTLESYSSLNRTLFIATNNNFIVAVGYDNKTNNRAFGQTLISSDGISWSPSLITFIINISGVASNIPL
jgi:hypothetical protein